MIKIKPVNKNINKYMETKGKKQSKEVKAVYIDLLTEINEERKIVTEERKSIIKSINELSKNDGVYNQIIETIEK